MRKPKSLPDKRRRLTQREESAVALIALRMVVAEREWNPGDAPVVRMLDMMFRVLEYQIAAKAFGAWLTRLGIQTLRKGGRKLVVVPVSFDEAEAALRKLTGAGHTLATAVKVLILEQACRMVESTKDSLRPETANNLTEVLNTHGQTGAAAEAGSQIPTPLRKGEAAGMCEASRKPSEAARIVVPPNPRKPLNDFLDEEED